MSQSWMWDWFQCHKSTYNGSWDNIWTINLSWPFLLLFKMSWGKYVPRKERSYIPGQNPLSNITFDATFPTTFKFHWYCNLVLMDSSWNWNLAYHIPFSIKIVSFSIQLGRGPHLGVHGNHNAWGAGGFSCFSTKCF